jgi:hypothetical protein
VKGIAPSILKSQVVATAAWALDGDGIAARAVREARDDERDPLTYFRLLLSAHYLTVATFCPTDVDARIRHHFWADLAREDMPAALACVDSIAALDAEPVSARVLSGVSGHDGEWFSVRAGALGRALTLEDAAATERLTQAIDDELAREAALFVESTRSSDVQAALSAATILAHNTGDLSRVVEAWPKSTAHDALRGRYARLGHESDRNKWQGAFFRAGIVNRDVMAIENHRFLALRAPRALRQSRALLLPIGPFFTEWGRTVARQLDEDDRAEVVAALLETHLRGPEQQGVLRALHGIVEANSGPWSRIVDKLPARLRKVATQGAIPAGIRVPEHAFRARLENRYRAACP